MCMSNLPPNIIGFEKFINSDVIKGTYPMVEKITVDEYDENTGDITFKIIINSPIINANNMYEEGFDPHYLIDNHIEKLSGYFNVSKTAEFSFDVYNKYNGNYVVGYEYKSNSKKKPIFYSANKEGKKIIEFQ